MSYQGYMGFFKQHTTALSTGRYWLAEDSQDVTLGEPVVWHSDTGFVANPKRKRKIKAYDNATPGAIMPIGVSLDILLRSSGVDEDDLRMNLKKYYPREITVMKIGICPIKNVSTGLDIDLNDTVIPAINGCESIGAKATGLWSDTYTLGKALEDIPATHRGLVWVNPESFEKNDQS